MDASPEQFLAGWPSCAVPDCPNKTYGQYGPNAANFPDTDRCYPHHHYGNSAPVDLMEWPGEERKAWLASRALT